MKDTTLEALASDEAGELWRIRGTLTPMGDVLTTTVVAATGKPRDPLPPEVARARDMMMDQLRGLRATVGG